MAETKKNFHFRMLTPTRTMFDDDVEMVIFRAEDGDVGIMPGHTPLTTVLGYAHIQGRKRI